jgi:hypothetical protein
MNKQEFITQVNKWKIEHASYVEKALNQSKEKKTVCVLGKDWVPRSIALAYAVISGNAGEIVGVYIAVVDGGEKPILSRTPMDGLKPHDTHVVMDEEEEQRAAAEAMNECIFNFMTTENEVQESRLLNNDGSDFVIAHSFDEEKNMSRLRYLFNRISPEENDP